MSLAAGDDGITFYALNGNSTAMSITTINGQTDKVENTIPAPSDAVSITPAPNEDSVYVLEPNGVVSQITAAGGHISTQFPIGHSGRALAIGPNGNTLYVLKGQGAVRNVAVVNLATESVKEVIPPRQTPKTLCCRRMVRCSTTLWGRQASETCKHFPCLRHHIT